jgi:hypothetical protein
LSHVSKVEARDLSSPEEDAVVAVGTERPDSDALAGPPQSGELPDRG